MDFISPPGGNLKGVLYRMIKDFPRVPGPDAREAGVLSARDI